MTSDTRCGTTDLLVSACGCRAHRGAPPPPDPFESVNEVVSIYKDGPGPWFPAAFSGECSGCGFEYEVGVMIRADGYGGWEAEECCG